MEGYPQSSPQTITLKQLGEGAAEELFQASLRQVLDNIDDLNTEATAKRSITLTVDFAVDEERRAAKVEITCSAKLAGVKPVSANVFLGRHEGQLAAVEAPRQEEMFPQPAGRPRATQEA